MTGSKFMRGMWVCASLLAILPSVAVAQSFTVATFADPSENAAAPLFTVDFTTDRITGGWADSQVGLDLIVGNTVYADTFFEMSPLTYTVDSLYGTTQGGGTIWFYADGDQIKTSPLLQIDFLTAHLAVSGLAGDNILSGDKVVFTGSAIAGPLTDQASFSFAFTNQTPVYTGSTLIGMTATSAFTSSAVPEPATVSFLFLGALPLLRRRS